MKADDRRKEIVSLLMSEQNPTSGTALAKHFGVSRQIIVQDISILKAAGFQILSTHSGYLIHQVPFSERIFKVRHTSGQTEDELNLIVDLGGTVADVFVWHKVYGKVSAKLNISSRLHVRQFLERIRSGKSKELMNITDGYHYHTVLAESEEVLDQIEKTLIDERYIVPEI